MSSRIHRVELSRRDRTGIALGWASLFLLAVGLLGYAGNGILNLGLKIILGGGVAVGIAYLALRKNAAVAVITSPNTFYRANATVFILSVLAVLVLVNYVGSRRYYRADLTKNRLYSLSPQSKDVLKGLKEEVTVTAFYDLGGPNRGEGTRARDLLKQYTDAAPGVKVEFIDPQATPAKATAKGFSGRPGVIWVEAGGRKEQVYEPGEQELTSAIVRATNPTKRKVYFLYGHGEKDSEATDELGLSYAKTILEKLGFETSRLVLQAVKTVPADASVVVIAGPTQAIPAGEQKLLADYLNKGGKMLLQLDAGNPVPASLVQPWGVEVGNNVIIDPQLNPGIAVVQDFETHQINKDAQVGYFPLARSVSAAATPPEGVNAVTLARTPAHAWGEAKLNGPFQHDADDLSGPVPVAAAATRPVGAGSGGDAKSARLVVFGNSYFGTNMGFQATNTSNARLFLNSITWLTEGEGVVNIPVKQPDMNQVTLTAVQQRWIFLSTVLIVPLGVLLTGVALWWRRR